MNTPHPELEQLAAMADADVDATAAADNSAAGAIDVPGDVLAHVVDCEQCAADLAALRGVRATLRSLPPVSMPADVAQRLESALRAAASGAQTDGDAPAQEPIAAAVSVLPAGGARRRDARRGSSSGLPNFSVAAAVTVFLVIALGVGLGVGLSHNSGAKRSSSGATSMAAGAGSIVLASGTDYNQDNIRNQVAGLVLSRVPDAHAAYKGLGTLADSASRAAASAAPSAPVGAPTVTSGGAAAPTASPSSSSENAAPTPSLSTRAVFSGPLGDPAQLQACVQALLDQPATPVLVDYAYYAGKPATIIVLKDPADPSTLDVYVEADTADCAKSGDVTFVAFLRNAS